MQGFYSQCDETNLPFSILDLGMVRKTQKVPSQTKIKNKLLEAGQREEAERRKTKTKKLKQQYQKARNRAGILSRSNYLLVFTKVVKRPSASRSRLAAESHSTTTPSERTKTRWASRMLETRC